MTGCNFTREPFADGKLFHARPYGSERGPMWEVYSMGLDQWAECHTEERAKMIAALLNSFYNAPRTDSFGDADGCDLTTKKGD